ncbi:TetR/AcrR family transcriptional regulator C-terminal domain-containing protein [Neobacillus jeddahensis]|uniref:TetR/AcrR family transcriptional regulator C-terminal domain-containing protein n=1 Tax=Neobacillus jeddahensis TaxID=1461580 RepID=UPI00058B9532|nr:TetR/AcrR family transcriptional regulator C-terminal domain-containing protein [Neobacillus jeddahensis]
MKKNVNKETITEAALEILHEKGLAQLTMRNVAAKLNVKAPALYWYIKNKHELLQLIAEHISSLINFPKQQENWEDEIILLSIENRRAMLSIPNGAEIMMETLPVSTKRLYAIDQTMEIFHRAQFPEDVIFFAVTLINSYVTSFVLDEQKQERMLTEMGEEEVYKQFTDAIMAIPKDAIPYVHHHLLYRKGKVNDEENFLAGLRIILQGIKAEIRQN